MWYWILRLGGMVIVYTKGLYDFEIVFNVKIVGDGSFYDDQIINDDWW